MSILWYEPVEEVIHDEEDTAGAVDGKILKLGGKYASVTLQVTGTMSDADIEFEGSMDGENFASIQGTKLVDGTSVTATGANTGLFRIPVVGLNYLKAKKTGSGTGPITVKAVISAASA